MANRKAAEQVILEGLSALDPSGENTKIMQTFFDGMTDRQFDDYMTAIAEGREYVSMVYANLEHSPITVDNNLAVAKKWGHNFFQRLKLTDPTTGMTMLTPLPYPVFDLPIRRQVQMLKEKISIPEDNKHIDDYTDQPTGVSKGSGISFPEMLVLYSNSLDRSIEEMIKFRGGDLTAMNAMDRSIAETGEANLDHIARLGTRVKSTQTMATLLKAMHLDNNFV